MLRPVLASVAALAATAALTIAPSASATLTDAPPARSLPTKMKQTDPAGDANSSGSKKNNPMDLLFVKAAKKDETLVLTTKVADLARARDTAKGANWGYSYNLGKPLKPGEKKSSPKWVVQFTMGEVILFPFETYDHHAAYDCDGDPDNDTNGIKNVLNFETNIIRTTIPADCFDGQRRLRMLGSTFAYYVDADGNYKDYGSDEFDWTAPWRF